MTTPELRTLIEHADDEISYGQFRTWVVAQALEAAYQRYVGEPDVNR
jgi:hypothetical protein